jgi:hypothetical protein
LPTTCPPHAARRYTGSTVNPFEILFVCLLSAGRYIYAVGRAVEIFFFTRKRTAGQWSGPSASEHRHELEIFCFFFFSGSAHWWLWLSRTVLEAGVPSAKFLRAAVVSLVCSPTCLSCSLMEPRRSLSRLLCTVRRMKVDTVLAGHCALHLGLGHRILPPRIRVCWYYNAVAE